MIRTISLAALLAVSLFGGTVTDDFESYALGAFPSPTWSDVGAVFNNGQILPSAFVVATTNAFGGATQALAIRDQLGSSRGIYAPTDLARFYSLAADIRVDRFADNSQAAPSDWAMQLTFAHNGVASYDVTPQAGIYASSLTKSWRLFLIGEKNLGADIDLGVLAAVGVWYRVQLDADALTGEFRSRISDVLTGNTLVDNTTVIPNWQPNEAFWDSIAFFGGDLSGTTANLAVVDNVNISSSGPPAIPEPSTLAMAAIGALGLFLLRRK